MLLHNIESLTVARVESRLEQGQRIGERRGVELNKECAAEDKEKRQVLSKAWQLIKRRL